MSILRCRKIICSESVLFLVMVSLLITLGCQTTGTRQKSYRNEDSKHIHNIAILNSVGLPDMTAKLRTDEQFITTLMAGPVIPAQIMLRLAFYSDNREVKRMFNSMVFDVDIGEMFCESLNTKLQLCSCFDVVPQEGIHKNKAVWKLLEKKTKELVDYRTIGSALGIDTILEIGVLSYGVKDPGIFSRPYAFLEIGATMTKAADGTVLWKDVIAAKSVSDQGIITFDDTLFGDVESLKEEFENVVDIVSEECLVRLGIDTHNTYILDKDYFKGKNYKIDISKKLNTLNNIRYEALITNNDYKELKQELVDMVKGNKSIYPKERKSPHVEVKKKVVAREVEKTRSGLPPLPRRD